MKEGWQETPLEDCLDHFKIAAKIPKKDFAPAGAFPVISQEAEFINGYWDGESDLSRVDGPVVIYGDHTQVVKYVDFDFVVGADGVKVLRPKGFIDPKYLFYFVMAHRVPSLGYARHYRHLKEQSIEYPPLEEQRRIVAVLDEAFEGLARARAHAEANLQNARELFRNSLEFELQAATDCQETTLGEHIDLVVGFAFKSKGYTDEPDAIRLMRGDNILPGAVRWQGVKYWPTNDIDQYERYQLAPGDVLIAMDRTWIKSGIKFAVLSEYDVPSLLVQRVARLRPLPTLDVDFLANLIGGKSFERYVLSIQTGVGVPHISGKQIGDFPIRLPSLETQQQISDRLRFLRDRCGSLVLSYGGELSDLDDLRQSLLEKAFSGQLVR